jgi:putative FmdB family regulatory protein
VETLLFTYGIHFLRLKMPTYEYKCEKCGDFEIWQSIKDNALSVCPACGSRVERQISANVGFVFKGSGFYQNEYKNPPAAPVSAGKPAKDEKASLKGTAQEPSKGSTPSTGSASSGQAGCGACGSPDPCPSGNN